MKRKAKIHIMFFLYSWPFLPIHLIPTNEHWYAWPNIGPTSFITTRRQWFQWRRKSRSSIGYPREAKMSVQKYKSIDSGDWFLIASEAAKYQRFSGKRTLSCGWRWRRRSISTAPVRPERKITWSFLPSIPTLSRRSPSFSWSEQETNRYSHLKHAMLDCVNNS